MATKTEKQYIRQATGQDYEAVMAINDHVSEGADYLPIIYNDFINDPMTRCYVLEIDNVVVGWYYF